MVQRLMLFLATMRQTSSTMMTMHAAAGVMQCKLNMLS